MLTLQSFRSSFRKPQLSTRFRLRVNASFGTLDTDNAIYSGLYNITLPKMEIVAQPYYMWGLAANVVTTRKISNNILTCSFMETEGMHVRSFFEKWVAIIFPPTRSILTGTYENYAGSALITTEKLDGNPSGFFTLSGVYPSSILESNMDSSQSNNILTTTVLLTYQTYEWETPES